MPASIPITLHTRVTIDASAERHKANDAKLTACTGHVLVVDHEPLPGGRVLAYRCTVCGGTMSGRDGRFYKQGITHGQLINLQSKAH